MRCYCLSFILFRQFTRCMMRVIWDKQPAHSSPPKSVIVAFGVGGLRRGSGFRRGSTRAQGLRPRPVRGEAIRRLPWSPRSPRTLRTAWRSSEPSSVPPSTRTPRKRPAGPAWTQSPPCTMHNYLQSHLHGLVYFLSPRTHAAVCVGLKCIYTVFFI